MALGLILASVSGCGWLEDTEDAAKLLFEGEGEIPREILGIGNEFNPNPRGGAVEQANDIRFNLGLRHVRVTFFFDQSFLPSEEASPNFSRFDRIVNSLPEGTTLLPILAYAPSWLANRADWKQVFIERYVIPVLDRYGRDARIGGWEIWNEPDGFCNGRNGVPPGVLDCSADDYVDLVRRVTPVVRARTDAPIVGAASTSINQSFPTHLNFNRAMVDAGLLNHIDVYNFHWFGGQLEKLFAGIRDFLNGTGKRLWLTETNARGATNHLDHAEEVFPALNDNLGQLERIYIFTYFDGASPPESFGLVLPDGGVSELYTFLRDNP